MINNAIHFSKRGFSLKQKASIEIIQISKEKNGATQQKKNQQMHFSVFFPCFVGNFSITRF